MNVLQFVLNDRPIEERSLAPTTTLLRYLRDSAGLSGTKEGCAEGDCGACTVAVLEEDAGGRATWRAINSCLVLLPMVQGKRVVTVEGLAQDGGLHPAQEVLARALGSQCGYCTPGIVMSLFEASYRTDLDAPWKLDAQLCGNLCRCTGYRPIRDAARHVAGSCPQGRFLGALASPPRAQMGLSYQTPSQRFFTPASLEELWQVLEAHPQARLVNGGTDLSLEVTKRFAEPPLLVSLEALAPLKVLRAGGEGLVVGAGVRLTDLEDFAARVSPPLERMLRYFGARQIKNRATVGGNLCTASPIGDLPPVLLALDARAVLLSRQGERTVALEDFFTGYRKTALREGEVLARVEVPPLPSRARALSYKVSKRRELDISTVAAAFCVELDGEGRVARARLAYGGMAATPARARATEAALVGQPWTQEALEAVVPLLAEDFRPLSDHRGSADYRLAVAQNLLRGFLLETREEPQPRLAERHAATVQVR
jgi:xanthine dehydrogenase small subunit